MTPEEMDIRRVAVDAASRPEHFGFPPGTKIEQFEAAIRDLIKRAGEEIAREFPEGVKSHADLLACKAIVERLFPWNQNLPVVRE